MGSNLVIVAIPDENDPVWQISSEKIPHLTLLFLGDTDTVDNLDQIVLFIEHAARIALRRFYLTVDRRDVLGADQADVVFFKKDRYDYKMIRDFRAALLQDNNIKKAYDSATQFDNVWLPHLTLGYPATPAKAIPENFGSIYDVTFNKIAAWTGDFDGPEFLLKDYADEYETLEVAPMDVAMSDIHHAATVSDTPWSQFKDSDYTDEQYARACLLDRGANAGTAKQRYSLPVREPNGTLNRNGCHAAAAVLSSKGGSGSARGSKMSATPEQLAAARKKLVALYKGPLNEDVPEGLGGSSMAQTTDLKPPLDVAMDRLEHFGVKGMHWGVRKEVHPAIAHIPKKTRKEAASDAEEFTRAKLFFGEGAGTRRKLINAKVEAKKKKDPLYSKAFDHFVGRTDLGKRAAQARQQRKRTDRKTATKKTAKGVVQVLRGNSQRANTAAVVGVGAASFLAKRHLQSRAQHSQEEVMDETVSLGAEFLEHHGVKGMKWGVRKAVAGVKAVGRGADNLQFEVGTQNKNVLNAIARGASKTLKKEDLPALKQKHGAAGKRINRIKDPLSPEAKAYRQDVKAAYLHRLEQSANSLTNFQGNRRYTTAKEDGTPNTSKYFWHIHTEKIAHAANDEITDFRVHPVFDVDGFITDIELVDDAQNQMAQTLDLGEEFISHFGVKGMHWGVRKAAAVTTQTHIDTGLRKRRTKVQAKGGESHPAHPDAVVAAVQKQKLKKSGTDALSTSELRSLANRLQLEGQVRGLATKKGQKFVSKQLEETGKQQIQKGIGVGIRTGGPHVVRKVSKKAATAATIAALA